MLVLSLLWIAWCILHSLLIDTSVQQYLRKFIPKYLKYFRVFYNLLSLLTLLPLVWVTITEPGQLIFSWQGYSNIIRFFLLGAAVTLYYTGAKGYDLQYFLGIEQIKTGEGQLLLGGEGGFSDKGVFGVIRHPWYLGSLCLLWSILPAYHAPIFLAVSILSMYLVVGTLLEERKILKQYPAQYRDYQQRVSMLFPWKWILARLRSGR
jgi:hypothetical protein